MTKFTGWVTEMFTFRENGYTVAMAFATKIVEIQWLPLTKIGFLRRAKAFHNITAKGIYVTKRARPDISLSIAFLTTSVKGPDIDDWHKLCHLVEYLRSPCELPLILTANGTGVLSWYVDASFAMHPDMRGHTGGATTMGTRFFWTSQPNTNSTHVDLRRLKLLLSTI